MNLGRKNLKAVRKSQTYTPINDIRAKSVEDQPIYIKSDPLSSTQPSSVESKQRKVDAEQPSIDYHSPRHYYSHARWLKLIQPPSVDHQPSNIDTQPPSVDYQSVGSNLPSVEPPDTDPQRRTRKRKANSDLCKTKVSKLLRNSGKAYTSMSKSRKLRNAKQMRPTIPTINTILDKEFITTTRKKNRRSHR